MKTMRPFSFLKTAVAMVMALAACLPFAQAQTNEDGTEDHPFLIENKDELKAFHDCMIPGSTFYHDGHTFKVTCSGDTCKPIPPGAQGMYFKLMADIVINEGNVAGCDGNMEDGWVNWRPMESFSGVFDGNYHTVSGIYCDTNASSVAFFSAVSGIGAEVKNLGVVNSYFKGNRNVAGIVGEAIAGGAVTHCFFEGTIENLDMFTGGIVSLCEGGSSITDCYATGAIYANDSYCGGIVGRNYSGSSITNCYSLMNIRNTRMGTTGCIYGYNEGTVTNCYYDKQFCRQANPDVVGKITAEMTSSAWTALGSAFQPVDGFYPFLKNFDFFENPNVRLSVLPVFLYAPSSVQYETSDDLRHNIKLSNTTVTTAGNSYSTSWSVDSWSGSIVVDGDSAKIKKQGYAKLIVSLHGITRTYILYSSYGPALGTDSNPFTIDNLDDLLAFRKGVNEKIDFVYKRITISYSNMPNIHWLQTRDIDVSEAGNWDPIGPNANTPFAGYYDGGNHEIQNLHFSDANRGLFGYLRNADIRRLGFRNPVFANCSSHVGTLAADVEAAVIDSCYVTGDAASIVLNSSACGALIGYVRSRTEFANGDVYVSHCYNTCDVTNNGAGQTGGLIGVTDVNGVKLYISYCYNTGNVSMNRRPSSGWYDVGGILGGSSMQENTIVEIRFCYNTGNIFNVNGFTGGILGDSRNNGTKVYYCFNIGDVTCEGGTGGWNVAGGIAGVCTSADVQCCFNTGKVTHASWGGQHEVMGISLYSTRCANFGDVDNTKYSYKGVAAGCASRTATASYNVGRIFSSSKSGAGASSSNSYFDTDFSIGSTGSTAKTTAQMLGTGLRSALDTVYWIYADGMYPRLKWTDSLDWARDIAIAASTPVLFATEDEDADHVKPGVQLYGRNNNYSMEGGGVGH